MNFAEWLKIQENATGTNCVATFARPSIPMVRRMSVGPVVDSGEDPFFKKRKKKKKLREALPARKLDRLPPLKLVFPADDVDRGPKGTLHCPTCNRPSRLKHMRFAKYDDEGNIVGGMCPRCMMRAFLGG